MSNKILKGLKWSAIERITTQVVQLSTLLLLGRVLGPDSFGLVGMLSIFIAISQTIVDSGLSNALIRKQQRTELDYSTVFVSNLVISSLCYVVVFFIAPYVSEFYGHNELELLLRVLGLNIVINSLGIVKKTKLTVKLDFKTQTKVSFFSIVLSSSIALYLAYNNFGVWSLVFQSLAFATFNVTLLFFVVPSSWDFRFSKSSFKELFGFGSKLLVSSLIDTVYKNIYQIVIGKYFSANSLGTFYQARNLSSIPAMTLTSTIQRVTYPMLSEMQSDVAKLENAYLLTLRLSALIVFPIMIYISTISELFVTLVLGDAWASTSTYITILCYGFMLYPIHSINLNLLKVKGRSDLFLKLEVIKKSIITIVLFFTVPLGVEAICWGIVFQSYFGLLLNTKYSDSLLSLSLRKQISSLIPTWLACIIIGFVSLYTSYIYDKDLYKLIYITVVSGILYFIFIFLFQRDLWDFILVNLFKNNE